MVWQKLRKARKKRVKEALARGIYNRKSRQLQKNIIKFTRKKKRTFKMEKTFDKKKYIVKAKYIYIYSNWKVITTIYPISLHSIAGSNWSFTSKGDSHLRYILQFHNPVMIEKLCTELIALAYIHNTHTHTHTNIYIRNLTSLSNK